MSQRRAPTIAARRVFQPLAMQRTAVPGIAAERILIAGPKGLQCLPATMAPLARVAFAATRRPLPAAFPPVQTALFSAKTTYETAKDRTSAGNGSQSSIPAWRAVIRRPFRKLFGLLAAGAVLGYAYSSLTDPTFSERMRRLRRVYGTFLPSFLEYKYNTLFVLRNASEDEKAAKYLDLDRKWAPNYLETILDLRGAYVKFAQVVLTRPDLLESEEFRRVLAPLLDSVPQEPSDVIEAIVCRNLGISSISEAFDDFEPTALGTASIAQVHGAKLKDGTEVVIKVRLPNAERNFDLDLRTMEAMVRMAQPEMLPAHKEIRNMVKRELDFRNEAKSMEVIGEGIRNSGRFPNVVVPRPIPGLCTDEIVVMTRLRGQKLFSRVLEHYETFAKEIGMTLEQLKEEMTAKFKSGDAQPASWRTMLSQPKLLWALARTWWFEAVGWWLPTFLTNIVRTVKLEPRISYPPAPLPTNHMALFDTVARVHGFQVLSLGEFNGDAHAGNIFLLDDGKIGLLDFGATRTLNEEERLNLASNIHLLTEPVLDVKRIAERTKALGFVSEKQLDYTAYMWAIILFHRDDPSVLVGKDGEKFADMGTFQQYLMNVDKTVQFPEQFFLAARLALLLRGLALLLGLGGVSVAEFWKDEATRAQALLGKDSSRS